MTEARREKAIGERIREIRGPDTQEMFAEKIGVTRSSLANYETGRTIPNRRILAAIEQITGASLNDSSDESQIRRLEIAAIVALEALDDYFREKQPAIGRHVDGRIVLAMNVLNGAVRREHRK